MNDEFLFYALCLIALVIVGLVVKKVASCLIKTVVLLLVVAAVAAAYFLYFQ
jgi:hypothetical protein